MRANEAKGRAFEQCDFIMAAVNPGAPFSAEARGSSNEKTFIDVAVSNNAARSAFRGLMAVLRIASGVAPKLPLPLLTAVAQHFPEMMAMGALTMISNLYGNPAVSIPSGL